MHMAPRGLRCYQHCPGQIQPNHGIIAGCTQSTTFAKVYLNVVLQGLWDRYQTKMAKGITAKPQHGLGCDIRSFVDDISVTTHSSEVKDPITKKYCIVQVARDLAAQLAAGISSLKGKISPKTTIIGNNCSLNQQLCQALKKGGIHTKVAKAAKDLGIGRSGGHRRTMIGIIHRKKAAKLRASRVTYLTSKDKRAKALYGTGVLPQATYGAETTGYSPTFVTELRTMAADATGTSHKGRCPYTAIAVAKGMEWDPYVRGPVSLIQEWCRVAPKVHLPTLQRAWTAMEQQLTNASNPWQKVKGPMGAAYMHLKEMGWTISFDNPQDKILYTDTKGDSHEIMDGVSWHEFKTTLEEERISQLWTPMSQHRGGSGLAQGADLTAGTKHYAS